LSSRDLHRDHEILIACLRQRSAAALTSEASLGSVPSFLAAVGPSADGILVKADMDDDVIENGRIMGKRETSKVKREASKVQKDAVEKKRGSFEERQEASKVSSNKDNVIRMKGKREDFKGALNKEDVIANSKIRVNEEAHKANGVIQDIPKMNRHKPSKASKVRREAFHEAHITSAGRSGAFQERDETSHETQEVSDEAQEASNEAQEASNEEEEAFKKSIEAFNENRGASKERREASKGSYQIMVGLSSDEASHFFNDEESVQGLNEEGKDRYLRTLVRNLYDYHLEEIFAAVQNEYSTSNVAYSNSDKKAVRDGGSNFSALAAAAAALTDRLYAMPTLAAADESVRAGWDTYFYVLAANGRATKGVSNL